MMLLLPKMSMMNMMNNTLMTILMMTILMMMLILIRRFLYDVCYWDDHVLIDVLPYNKEVL